MFGEELLDPSVEVEIIFRQGEAVAFIGIHHINHFAFRLAQGLDHPVHIRDRDPRIVLALADEKRVANFINVIKRRNFAIQFFVVIEIAPAPSPARGDAM